MFYVYSIYVYLFYVYFVCSTLCYPAITYYGNELFALILWSSHCAHLSRKYRIIYSAFWTTTYFFCRGPQANRHLTQHYCICARSVTIVLQTTKWKIWSHQPLEIMYNSSSFVNSHQVWNDNLHFLYILAEYQQFVSIGEQIEAPYNNCLKYQGLKSQAGNNRPQFYPMNHKSN